MINKESTIIIAIYNDPEGYPPTLNMAISFASRVKQVILIGRHLKSSFFEYPENIKVLRLHPEIYQDDLNIISKWQKIVYFRQFVDLLKKEIIDNEPLYVICHDMLAAFAYWIIEKTLNKEVKPLFWYHNHDVIHKNTMPSFSVLWLANKFEKYFFNKIHIFSLPVEERKMYFPLKNYKGKIFVIPNYPMVKNTLQIRQIKKLPKDVNAVKLIFQGAVGKSHAFSEIINVLGKKLDGMPIELTLVGPIDKELKNQLQSKAKQLGVNKYLKILKAVPYTQLFEITQSHHIGLAILIPGERAIYKYGATSSNKIYEYAAAGLPVVLYDAKHYKKYLEKYEWTTFVTLAQDSILAGIKALLVDYNSKSQKAIEDFNQKLNYQSNFDLLWDKLNLLEDKNGFKK